MFRFIRLFSSQPGLTEVQKKKTTLNVATNSILFNELNDSLAARAELINVENNLKKLIETIKPLEAQLTANLSAELMQALRDKILEHFKTNDLFQRWQQSVIEEFDTAVKKLLPGNSTFGKEWHHQVSQKLKYEDRQDISKFANIYVESLKQLIHGYKNKKEINQRKIKIVRDYYNGVIVAFATQNKGRTGNIRNALLAVLNQNDHGKIENFLKDKSVSKRKELMKIVGIINPQPADTAMQFDQVVLDLQALSDSYDGPITNGRNDTTSLNYYFANTKVPSSPFNHVQHNANIKTQFKVSYQTYLEKLEDVDNLCADQLDETKVDEIISAIFSQHPDNVLNLEDAQAYLAKLSKNFVLAQAEWELIVNVARIWVHVEKIFAQSAVGSEMSAQYSKLAQALQSQKTVISIFLVLQEFTTVVSGQASFLQTHMSTLKASDLLPEVLHDFIVNPNAIAETEANLALLHSESNNTRAKKEAHKKEIIGADIDLHAANVLRNCYARALVLCRDQKSDETTTRLAKISDDIGGLSQKSFDQLVELIIDLFELHPNRGIYGEGLLPNSFDTRFLQLLYNEGVPVGLFNSSLVDIQGVSPDFLNTLPLSDLKGDVLTWHSGDLNKQSRKQIRDIAKQNLRDMATLLAAYKEAFASNEKTMPLIVHVDNRARLLSDFVLEQPESLTA